MTDRPIVMISSTVRDLPEHREQLRLACERSGFAPHEMQEHLTALNADAVQASMEMVERANVYVLVLGHRYGTVPDGETRSITEMEYDRAVELNKPRLVFLIHDDHPVTGKDVERGPGAQKLDDMKVKVGAERVAAFFESPDDLRGHAGEALTALKPSLTNKTPTEAAQAAIHRRTAIPASPALYAHPVYTLTPPQGLVGRQQELTALTDWVTTPTSPLHPNPLFCLVAIGGMGKSALAWHWATNVAPEEMRPAGRFWWSFYESDADIDAFLTRALAYTAGMAEEEARKLPWAEREAMLCQRLSEEPFLLVLDGLERTLRAYNTMEAAYIADDDLDDRTANRVAAAAGLPESAAQSFFSRHRLRLAIDPRFDRLLRRLAQVAGSRILITSRLYPTALQVETGGPCRGSNAYFLRGLSDEDAVGLWRGMGVSGSRAELLPVFHSVQSHPLLIRALAAEVANYRPAPGDFTGWRADNPGFDPATLPLSASRSHILTYALKGLTPAEREVLITIVGFRLPTAYDTLLALSVGKGKACAEAGALHEILDALEDRGLIGWDRGANRYDAHPIVRGVVWRGVAKGEREAVLGAMESHFQPMETPGWQQVESLAELAPAIERYHALVGLGRYDDAHALFRDRINEAMLYRLDAHRQRVEMLERLFPNGVDTAPALQAPLGRSWTLDALAGSYLLSGQPGHAAPLLERAEQIYADDQFSEDQQVKLCNLAQALFPSGRLRDGQRALHRALLISRKLTDEFQEGVCLRELGRLRATGGRSAEAVVALRRSDALFDRQSATQRRSLVAAYRAALALRLGDPATAAAWADRAAELAQDLRYPRDLIRSALLQGQAALTAGTAEAADPLLHQALSDARAKDLVEFELAALIALAELHAQREDRAVALERLDEVREPAEAGPYPMELADAANTRAAIARATGDTDAAIAAATEAYRHAWCDGPPYAYHWGLEAARAHLAALGAPQPELPPFDESRFEPLPEVEINPRDKHWVDPDAPDDPPEA
ncbi:MAG: DUF4062 domain-containing protein [Pseudomonadota bacterium]